MIVAELPPPKPLPAPFDPCGVTEAVLEAVLERVAVLEPDAIRRVSA